MALTIATAPGTLTIDGCLVFFGSITVMTRTSPLDREVREWIRLLRS